jgi:peptidoglycan-associated lipoprotein
MVAQPLKRDVRLDRNRSQGGESMRSGKTSIRNVARGGAILSLALLASCGYAKKKEVDAQFAQMRSDMQATDQALDQKITQVDGKVNEVANRVNGLAERTAALERDLQALRTQFNATVERMEGLLTFSVPVNFEFDKSDVRANDQQVLNKFAEVVKGYYPNAIVTVEGFTDPVGSQAYNQRLGRQRAESVKDVLVQNGLMGDRVRVVSYGEASNRLITRDGGPDRGMENRRVSLVIDYSGTGLVERVVTMR